MTSHKGRCTKTQRGMTERNFDGNYFHPELCFWPGDRMETALLSNFSGEKGNISLLKCASKIPYDLFYDLLKIKSTSTRKLQCKSLLNV